MITLHVMLYVVTHLNTCINAFAGRMARNRWLVAYTLLRNPSLQQHTANNIRLLQLEEISQKKNKVFKLEHILQNLSAEQEGTEEVDIISEAELEKTLEVGGVEFRPNGGVADVGVEPAAGEMQGSEEGKVVADEGWSEGEGGTDVPYQRWD